jgi:hypothetical protein
MNIKNLMIQSDRMPAEPIGGAGGASQSDGRMNREVVGA